MENNIKAIPSTYIHIKYSTDKIFLFTPEITTTAKEEAHGIKPVKIPTVKGFFIFELVNFPLSCPQFSLCLCLF